MTLVQMQYFAAVCRTLNVTHAAQELHLTQPTLSASCPAKIPEHTKEQPQRLLFCAWQGIYSGESLHPLPHHFSGKTSGI